MFRLFKILRNNWKKTIFFGIVGYVGTDKLSERFRINEFMRELAKEAESYGKGPLPAGARPKHITVLLNPASGNRKGQKMFEYAEPLIHLSGFLVNVVKTEKISEARELVELVEKTNIIAVAGGDGTLMEVVTGLLRRDDADDVVRRFPIGVIPVGRQNSVATAVLNYDSRFQKDSIAQAAMGISRHNTKSQDVIKVELIHPAKQIPDEDALESRQTQEPVDPNQTELEENTQKKPYYIMNGFKLGDFCEAERRESEMPSFLHAGFSHLWSLLRTSSAKSEMEVRYLSYCPGCSNCKSLWVKPEEENSMFGRVKMIFRPSVYAQEDPKWSTVNPQCGVWDSISVDTIELNVVAKGNGKLEIQVGKDFSKPEFVSEGLQRRYKRVETFSKRITCQEVEIIPTSKSNTFYMDNEDFPVKPMRMEVLRNRVNFFTIR